MQLRFSAQQAAGACTTRLTERTHSGPLRVQKPLYPEGAACCHAVIVHPPGGVAGGDELHIQATVEASAQAFITTPGAAKWYKANGKISRQSIDLRVDDAASLEWMPQETIFFDAADVQLSSTISLGSGASYIGCEIFCFGRTASGERFRSGKVSQCNSIRREGKLIWYEQAVLHAGSAAMQSPLGMGSHTVAASLLAVGPALATAQLEAVRNALQQLLDETGAGQVGVTQLKELLLVRYVGDCSETARRLMLLAWRHVRPHIIGREGLELRLWNT